MVINVCNTKEVLFKFYDGFYALFMLSNNMESYLSKLDENVAYRTTDAIKRKFKIVNNNLVCL